MLITTFVIGFLAIGPVMQNVISNFVAGVFIYTDKPFKIGDSDVGLQSRIWIADPSRADFVRTRGEYVTEVTQRFDEEGIDIPYPLRTLEGGLALEDATGVVQPAE